MPACASHRLRVCPLPRGARTNAAVTRGQGNVLLPVTRSVPDLTFLPRKMLVPILRIRKYAIAIIKDVDIQLPP